MAVVDNLGTDTSSSALHLNGNGDGTQTGDKGNAGNGTMKVLPAPPGEPYVAAGCSYFIMGNFDLDYVRSVSAGYGLLTNDDPAKANQARRLFQGAIDGERALFTSLLVIAEIVSAASISTNHPPLGSTSWWSRRSCRHPAGTHPSLMWCRSAHS